MKRMLKMAYAMAGAYIVIALAAATPASATTLALPDGSSEASFSIQTSFPDTLSIGPLVTVNTNGCPNLGCANSYWDVSFTVDFLGQSGNLLASDSANVSENCNPSGCTMPRTAFFAIPLGSTEFQIFNDVTVGGGWTYVSASEFISAENSPIAETPIPDAIFLFAAGLGLLSTLMWKGKNRVAQVFN
jgi:hypothetical protein